MNARCIHPRRLSVSTHSTLLVSFPNRNEDNIIMCINSNNSNINNNNSDNDNTLSNSTLTTFSSSWSFSSLFSTLSVREAMYQKMYSSYYSYMSFYDNHINTCSHNNYNHNNYNNNTKMKMLLYGCETIEEHRDGINEFMCLAKSKHGREGLHACGFHYAFVPCRTHSLTHDQYGNGKNNVTNNKDATKDDDTDELEKIDPQIPSASISAFTKKCTCECGTKLHHTLSNTIITNQNRQSFIADGEMYDKVATLCQEYAQQFMIQQSHGQLKYLQIGNATLLVSDWDDNGNDNGNDDRDEHDNDCDTFVIATGSGKVRAGIFSRLHLITTSIEASTALPFVQRVYEYNNDNHNDKALSSTSTLSTSTIQGEVQRQSKMKIILLDPNARNVIGEHGQQQHHGSEQHQQTKCTMDDFEECMNVLFLNSNNLNLNHNKENNNWSNNNNDNVNVNNVNNRNNQEKGSIYILAHSASGGQLARYFMTDSGKRFIHARNIQSIVFTDSTHNIQWFRHHRQQQQHRHDDDDDNDTHLDFLLNLFQSSKSIYIRSKGQEQEQNNNRTCATKGSHGDRHTSNRSSIANNTAAATPTPITMNVDQFWKHRFGTIKTLWGGTNDHSIMNYYAYDLIWDHFDSCRKNIIV